MKKRVLRRQTIMQFQQHLEQEEKSVATVEKYVHDVTAFHIYLNNEEISKETVIAYKQYLIDNGYAVRSINSMLASLNSLFEYLGWNDLRVKAMKLQHAVFCPEEKELTRAEYERLRLVCPAPGKAPNLVLVEARRGGKPGLKIEPALELRTAAGEESEEYKRIYHRS